MRGSRRRFCGLCRPSAVLKSDLVAVDVHPHHRELWVALGVERHDVPVGLVLQEFLHGLRQRDRHDRTPFRERELMETWAGGCPDDAPDRDICQGGTKSTKSMIAEPGNPLPA